MIFTLAALAILLAFAIAGVYCTVAALTERYVRRHTKVGTLPPSTELQGAALDLIVHCTALELHNSYLQARQDRTRELTAAAIMFTPRYRTRQEKMTIHEAGEAP